MTVHLHSRLHAVPETEADERAPSAPSAPGTPGTPGTPGALPGGKLLLTAGEAAARLGISRATLYRLLPAGDLRSVKIGWTRRIAVADLEAYVARLRTDGRGAGNGRGAGDEQGNGHGA